MYLKHSQGTVPTGVPHKQGDDRATLGIMRNATVGASENYILFNLGPHQLLVDITK